MVILLFYGASVIWMKIFWIVKFVYFLYSIWIWYSKCFVYQAYPKHAVFSANILDLVFVLKIISGELFLDVFFSFEMHSLNCLLWSFVYFVFGLFAFSYSLEGILCILGFPGGASGKEPTCQCRRQKRWFWSLGWEDPLEEGMAIHSSILAWRTHRQMSLVGYSP